MASVEFGCLSEAQQMAESENLATVFVALRGSLARAIQRIVPPREIEDIVQETYLRVCQANSDREIRSPRSFMFKTARNLALDHLKRAASRLSDSYDESIDSHAIPSGPLADDTFAQACSDTEFALFCDAVRYLPFQCRRAFVMRKVYGYTQKEIAHAMRISERTVEKHIAEGIKRCMYFMVRQDTGTHKSQGHAEVVRTARSRKSSGR
jgi:RNA polymerase sigma-70 factor (ECF subfamily)